MSLRQMTILRISDKQEHIHEEKNIHRHRRFAACGGSYLYRLRTGFADQFSSGHSTDRNSCCV